MNVNQQWVALLTEDEDDFLYWQHGFDSWATHLRLEWFASGNAFFARPELLHDKPTILLLDGLMPRDEEVTWLAKILNHDCCQNVHVIVLSDHFVDNQQQTFLNIGATACMLMPTSQEELQQAVAKISSYSR